MDRSPLYVTVTMLLAAAPPAAVAAQGRPDPAAAFALGSPDAAVEPARDSQTMPSTLYEATVRSLARDTDPGYGIDSRGHGANPRHGFELAFSPEGAHVVGSDGNLVLRLTRFGRGDGEPVRRAMPRITGAWVEYDRGPGLMEWFVNSPRGVEQGWTVSRRPAGTGPLTLEIDTGHELDEIHAGRFSSSGLVYHGLVAFDAEGRELPSLWRRNGTRLRIEVDDAAAAYPLVVDPWLQQAKLTSSDGEVDDLFGTSVALSGNVALVGAPRPPWVGSQGAAYIFTRSGSTWNEQAKLIASDGSAGDLFGEAVVLEDDTALVGAPHIAVGENLEQGAVYLFTRSDGTWSQKAKLTANDGVAYDYFGRALDLEGATALVGASGVNGLRGATYVFTRSGDIWIQQAKLVAVDEDVVNNFGVAVAISGDTALVGAPHTHVGDNFAQGAAYVYTRSGDVWTQQARLVADDGTSDDVFGVSVAIVGDTAVVGASLADVNGNVWQGAAYVLTRIGDSWSQQAKLTASDGSGAEYFGSSVALAGDTAIVGARGSGVAGKHGTGAVYFFTRNGEAWSQRDKLVSVGGMGGDAFGSSVAYESGNLLAGAPYAHVEGNTNQGAAYVFVSSPLAPMGLAADYHDFGTSTDGNGVFEPGEVVFVAPSWRNSVDVDMTIEGTASNFTGPVGADHNLAYDRAFYGQISPGQTVSCMDFVPEPGECFLMGVDDPLPRPAPHWDSVFDETLSKGTVKSWTLHIGDSFTDVLRSHLFYPWIETLLHHGVTSGCAASAYCPADPNTRGQMSVFLLNAAGGSDYLPPGCVEGAERFDDVPYDSPLCPWIEELARRGVTEGCDGDDYCPGQSVTRAQMAVFLLRALEGQEYVPPPCSELFGDVPCPSLFANWIEDLVAREITAGCGGDSYCPHNPVTRGQMAAFLARTFELVLYGP